MKRDMALCRELLLGIADSNDKPSWKKFVEGKSNEEGEAILHHLNLLAEAGFLKGMKVPVRGLTLWQDLDLTWEGHDFSDSVRDPDVWAKTKDGALQAGGWTFGLLKDLAKGFAKKKIEDLTGVTL